MAEVCGASLASYLLCPPVWLRLMAQSGIDPQMLAAITQSVLQAVSTMPKVVQNNGNHLSGSASTAAKSDSTCGIQKDSAGAALEGSVAQEGSAAPQEEDGTVSEDGESDAPDDDEDKEEETEKKSGKQSGKKKNLNKSVTVGKSGGRKGKRGNEEGDAASKPLKKKKGENSNGDGDHGLSGTEAEVSAPVAVGQKGSDTVRTTRSSVGAATSVQAAPPGETKKPRGRPRSVKSNGTPAPDEGVQVRVPSVMIDYHSYCMLCNKVESMSTRLDELMGKVDMLLRRPSRSPPPAGNHHTYGYHHGMPQYNHGMPHASSSSFMPQHNNQYQDATPHG